MSRTAPTAILSDALVNALHGRRVKVAVFLTFQFDPGFFEEEVLPLLFEQSFSHIPQIRLIQLEERLRGVDHMAVYYDRRGLQSGERSARLDYRRIGLHRHTGFFHPKNILLLVENQGDRDAGVSLLLATLSANLTQAGWWRNVEVAYITEVRAGDRCSFRRDLLRLIRRLKKETAVQDEHVALDSIRSFLIKEVEESAWSRKQGRLLPHLYYGQTSLPEFLQDFIDTDTFNLEVISPYFDEIANSQTLSRLIDAVQPKTTRVFLPTAPDGSAECFEDFYHSTSRLPQVSWGLLPETLTRFEQQAKGSVTNRYVHAKFYRFWNQSTEFHFIGSVNLTAPAHTKLDAGNFETGVLLEVETTGQQGWWLQPLGEVVPTEFLRVLFEDADITEPPCPMTLCFDWNTETLSYFWESSIMPVPPRVDLLSQNVFLFSMETLQKNKWIRMPAGASQQLKELLKSTSFAEIRVDATKSFRVLVQEEGMASKPGLFLALTPDEILQYWSLLSPEQREHFIVQKSLMDIDGYVRQSSSVARSELSMFDRFAGIFHAFGSLKRYVSDALLAGRESEAVYRLLGEKHDSLSALLEKIIQDDEADRVRRYVTLLSAEQLLNDIEQDFSDFKSRHKPAFRRVREHLKALDEIEAGFSFETPETRAAFFTWFREMFLRPAKLPRMDTE